MNGLVISYVLNTIGRFKRDEEGIALSEYLVLLGLLIGGVIVAVSLFGTNLGIAWGNWADWVISLDDGVVALMTP